MGEKANERIDVDGVLRQSSEIYRESVLKLWILAIILLAPAQVLSLLLDGPLTWWIPMLVVLPLEAWLIAAVVKLVLVETTQIGPGPSVGSLLKSALSCLVSMTVLSFMAQVAISIGVVFLIVPGVFLAVIWIVAPPALVIEKVGPFDALHRSFELTRGNRVRILPLVLVFLVAEALSLGVGFLLSDMPALSNVFGTLYSVIVYPFVVIVSTVLYLRLSGD